jgi:hypothetical protein
MALLYGFHPTALSVFTFFSLGLVEMRIWCIKTDYINLVYDLQFCGPFKKIAHNQMPQVVKHRFK